MPSFKDIPPPARYFIVRAVKLSRGQQHVYGSGMKTSILDYDLPPNLIAQHPCYKRDESRLLVVDRCAGSMKEDVFGNITSYLNRGDCLVMNNTKVIRARLRARKSTGANVEIFLLHEMNPGEWEALVRPSARVAPGTELQVGHGITVTAQEALPHGRRRVVFDTRDVISALEAIGEIPLPPYIHRETPEDADLTRYQTVYAQVPGAVAAPTAGLHFTKDVLDALERAGVRRAELTLHVGYGTFKPIQADTLEEHHVDPEDFDFPAAAADELNATRARGGRVTAVGTTATRVLETCYQGGLYRPDSGQTRLYVYPPYQFKAVDALLTNFHLPHSSLLALVCAFAGTELTLEAYRYAVKQEFRFYSYGDSMLIV